MKSRHILVGLMLILLVVVASPVFADTGYLLNLACDPNSCVDTAYVDYFTPGAVSVTIQAIMVRLYTRIGTSGSWPAWINAFIGAPDGCNLINTLNASATWGGGTDYTYQGDSDIYAEADCNGLSCSYGVSEIWFVLIGKLQSSYGVPLC